MLSELQAYHARILECIAELKRLLAFDAPKELELAAARLRLSKASAERARFIAEALYPVLLTSSDAKLLEELKYLADDFLAKRRVSSEHVTTWTSRAVKSDWPGYKAASQRIQQMMLDRIAHEKRVLYPALERR